MTLCVRVIFGIIFVNLISISASNVTIHDVNVTIVPQRLFNNTNVLQNKPDENTELHWHVDLQLQISSNVHKGIYNVSYYDILIPKVIPVYVYHKGKRVKQDFVTDNLHYYKGVGNGCDVTMNICTDERKESIDISIICKNESHDIHLRELNKTNNNVFNGTITRYHVNTSDLMQLKRRHDYVKTDIKFKHQSKRKRRSIGKSASIKFVEFFLIHDNSMFVALGNSTSTIISRSIGIVNIMDSIYRNYKVRIVLVGIDIWNEKDQVNVTSNSNDVLRKIVAYSKITFPDVDNAHLLTNVDFASSVIGLAYVGVMCSLDYSGGVNHYDVRQHYSLAAGTVAHEVGHNFNMDHDEAGCECPHSPCLMNPYSVYPTPKYFSDCSIKAMDPFIASTNTLCLDNKPKISLRDVGTCGNNVVEGLEECDCGPVEFCTNKCCNPSTCELTPGSQCAHGLCCNSDCQISSNTTICHNAKTECDISDVCDGVTEVCKDLYKENGAPCGKIDGICYEGRCKSRDKQCKFLFGDDAVEGSSKCYQTLNKYGKSYGHCGFLNKTENTYKRCTSEHVKCGKLHCENMTATYPIVGSKSGYTKVQLNFNGKLIICTGGTANLGRQQTDPGIIFRFSKILICLKHACDGTVVLTLQTSLI